MLKFILITLFIWFVITRLLRFKVVVYKGGNGRNPTSSYRNGSSPPEGTIRVDKKPENRKDSQSTNSDGDYVEYEEL